MRMQSGKRCYHRVPKNSHPLLWDQAFIKKTYLLEQKSHQMIADELGVNRRSVQNACYRFSVPCRKGNLGALRRGSCQKRPDSIEGSKRQRGKYIYIYHDKRWVAEHRLIIEQKLGRRLTRGENVHHIDGDTENNKPNNLILLTPQEHRIRTKICNYCPLRQQIKELALQEKLALRS